MKYLLFFSLIISFVFASQTQAQTRSQNKTVRKTVSAKRVAPVYRQATPQEMLSYIHQTAELFGIPPKLYESLLRVEGGGICNKSPKGARGIAQFMPDTARRFGLRVDSQIDERCDFVKATIAGAKYLKWLLNYFRGDVALALAGYNAGEGAVEKYNWRIPPYRETTQYVEKIGLLYTGKSGLSLSRAYDLQSAVKLITPIYSTRSTVVARPLQIQLPQTASIPETLNDEPLRSTEAISEKIEDKENKQPSTVRKSAVEIEPRIRTSSIFYWNNRQK